MNNFKLSFFLFIVFTLISHAFLLAKQEEPLSKSPAKSYQEIISLLEEAKRLSQNPQTKTTLANREIVKGKCGLGDMFDIEQSLPFFTPDQQNTIRRLLSPAVTQKSRVIGRFQIFYDTTGVDTPALIDGNDDRIPNTAELFVDSVGKYFNDAWDYEVDVLGFDSPPIGGSSYYQVYIKDFGFGYYGVTQFDNVYLSGTPPRYYTHVEIDNDFKDVYTSSRGIPGLKVTAAHEFHHAIQLGKYGYWSGEQYFYEITSTWMEDVVHDDVNDYIQYLSNALARNSQFAHPEYQFKLSNGEIEYSRCIWGKFIEKRFSRDIMRRSWEIMRSTTSIPAINQALQEVGSSFSKAFSEFAYWNLNCGAGTDTIKFYTEGRNYPAMRLKSEIEYMGGFRTFKDSVQTIASTYIPVCSRWSSSDTCGSRFEMRVIVNNLNLSGSQTWNPFYYNISDDGDISYKHLNNGVFVKLDVPDPSNWSTQESVPSITDKIIVYPNPFISNTNNVVNFRLPGAIQPTATLFIFSSTMDKIFSGDLAVENKKPLEPSVSWNGMGDNGDFASSGIYIFILQIDNQEYQGKFAIIRK